MSEKGEAALDQAIDTIAWWLRDHDEVILTVLWSIGAVILGIGVWELAYVLFDWNVEGLPDAP